MIRLFIFILAVAGLAGAVAWFADRPGEVAPVGVPAWLGVAVAIAAPLVGGFALFHGHAHVAEMGHQVLMAYVAGFAAAAAALHLAGFALARWIPVGAAGLRIKRLLGGALAGTGLVLLGS